MNLNPVAPPDGDRQETPGFEELTTRLDEVLALLEQGDLPLDQTLSAYERGVALVNQCNALLDQAELRVSELATSMASGEAPDPFDDLFGDPSDGGGPGRRR